MRFLYGEKKWSEFNILIIATFFSNFFLLFIAIELFLKPFYHSKGDLTGHVIQVDYVNNIATSSTNKVNLEAVKDDFLQEEIKIRAMENSQKNDPSNTNPPSSTILNIHSESSSSFSIPNSFSFNPPPSIENHNSVPILGGRSGFRSKEPSSPGPKKGVDAPSNQALETYRNQVGREAEKRYAKMELVQIMTSLETHEEYRCISKIRWDSTEITRKQSIINSPIVQCNPSSPKATFLEWVIGRLYPEDACITIDVSKLSGFRKLNCDH